LRAHDGRFDVGGEERGEFFVSETFDSEAEACDYLFETLTVETVPVAESAEERERSRQITRETVANLTKELDLRFGE
jgi:hypothetical protein